jgi:hypothetical protein
MKGAPIDWSRDSVESSSRSNRLKETDTTCMPGRCMDSHWPRLTRTAMASHRYCLAEPTDNCTHGLIQASCQR